MDLDIHKQGGQTIVALEGEIDFHSSPVLRERVLKLLDQGTDLIVDMTQVSFIDSSGIASLVEGLQHARGQKRQLSLAGVGETPMQVFRLTKLDTVFPMYDSLEAAVDRFPAR